MANIIGDYKLRPAHLLLLILLTISVLIWWCYWNEISQRIELQERLLFMERQLKSSAMEKSNLRQIAGKLQNQFENQISETNKLQKIHNFQIEQQNQNFMSEKDQLKETILSKDNSIKELTDQHETLKKQYEALHSEMQEIEKNQSRLLEKFSTQSAQCINIISMVKQLCYEKEGNKSRIEPKYKEKKKTTFIYSTKTVPPLPVINQTKDIFPRSNNTDNTAQRPDVKLSPGANTSVSNKIEIDTGDFLNTPTISPLGTNAQMSSSRITSNNTSNNVITQEIQSYVSENEKTKLMGTTIMKGLRKQLSKNDSVMEAFIQDKLVKSEKEDVLNVENKEDREIYDYHKENGTEENEDDTENELIPGTHKVNNETLDVEDSAMNGKQEDRKDIVPYMTEVAGETLDGDYDQEDKIVPDTDLEKMTGLEKQKTNKKENNDIVEKYYNEWSKRQEAIKRPVLYYPTAKYIYKNTKSATPSEIILPPELKRRDKVDKEWENKFNDLLEQNEDPNIREKLNLVTGRLAFEPEKKNDNKNISQSSIVKTEENGRRNAKRQIAEGASDTAGKVTSRKSQKKLPDVF